MTACALPCFMFTCVPSGKVRLIPDIGSVASAKPSAPSAVTGNRQEHRTGGVGRWKQPFVFRPVLRLTYQPFRFRHTKPFGIHPSFHAALVDMNFSQKGGQADFRILVEPYKIFSHAHPYRSSAVILLKILIWRQRYNDE